MKLELQNISHYYGKKQALSDFSCTLENGVYGLLGPNGAGKTTLIHIIVRIITPTEGSVIFDGTPIKDLQANYFDHVGFLPQYPKFYPNYTAEEFLSYMADCKGINRKKAKEQIKELFSFVNLEGEEKKKVGAYSGGMRQRLGIAQALLGNPSILILDEPTAGLDPKERIRFRNLISKISENHTVLLATHIVTDVESIAKEVIMLGDGKLIKQGSPKELMQSIQGKVWEYEVSESELDKEMLKQSVSNSRFEDGRFVVRSVSEAKPNEEAINVTPNLEDVYIYEFGGKK